MKLSPIISAEELLKVYQDPALVIVDAGSGGKSRENYQAKHLEKALYADLNEDLAEVPKHAKDGGRHPLPSLEKFADVLQKLGIDENAHVVIYDDKSASNAAARFWWMLKSAGFEKVQVLNGGLQNAEKQGLKTTSAVSGARKVDLMKIDRWKLPLIDISGVEKFSNDENSVIIDVREAERYHGEHEPIDLIAGHIPNAKNLPFKDNLDEDGLFKEPSVLKAQFEKLLKNSDPERIAVHCGSGVTACHTLLAMDYAGMELPKLYVGSWSEWSRNDKPLATT